MNEIKLPTCNSCRFQEPGAWHCRRYPPPFPITGENDWCGEHQPKPEPASEMDGDVARVHHPLAENP